MQTFVGKVEEFVRFYFTGRTYAGLDAGSSVPAETETCALEVGGWKHVEDRVLLILCLVILAYQCWV